jgi:hypothetical protein
MTRARGRTRDCDITDARARLVDARQFLDAAELHVAPGYGDVVATNAIHAAIAAADVICCVQLGQRSNDANHEAAVALLERADPDLANQLRRALICKQQAGYESRDLADSDAVACVGAARRLVTAAARAVERL